MSRARAAALWLVALASAPPAQAEHEPVWEIGAGVTVARAPDYRGADESEDYALPYPYLAYRTERFQLDGSRARGKLFASDRLVLDISANVAPPVDSDSNRARAGMPDLDATVEIGPSLLYRLSDDGVPWLWRVELPLRAAIATDLQHTEHVGWSFQPRISASGRALGGRLHVNAGPLYASQAFNDFYYSVEPAFATPQRPAYEAPGGYAGMRTTLTWGYPLRRGLLLGVLLRYEDLRGADFRDSPLVRDDDYLAVAVALTWTLARSDRSVPHFD